MSVTSNKQTPEDREKMLEELDNINPDEKEQDELDEDDSEVETDLQEKEPVEKEKQDNSEDDGVEDDEESQKPADDKGESNTNQDPEDKETDYKKRYSDSSRENQVLQLRLKKQQEDLEAIKNTPEPTEDQCKAEYGDEWEDMSPAMQKIAKKNFHSELKDKALEKINTQQKEDESYREQVGVFAADPSTVKMFPELIGNESKFENWAMMPTRRGLDLEALATIFVTNMQRSSGDRKALFPRNKTSLKKDNKPTNKMDAEKMKVLRTLSPREHQRMIRSGKLKPSDLLE